MKIELEVWKDVPLTAGYYQISNLGNLRSWVRKGTLWQPKREVPLPIVCCISKRGYYEQSFNYIEISRIKRTKIHRLVADAFIPNPKKLLCVNHINGNKLDNRALNLEWCTQSYNIKHAFKSGLIGVAEKRSKFNLSNEGALKIFNMTGPYKDIAALFGVNEDIVYSIKAGTSWSSVTGKRRVKCK